MSEVMNQIIEREADVIFNTAKKVLVNYIDEENVNQEQLEMDWLPIIVQQFAVYGPHERKVKKEVMKMVNTQNEVLEELVKVVETEKEQTYLKRVSMVFELLRKVAKHWEVNEMRSYKSMIDIEYDVNGIESYIRDKHGLGDHWYGDCYPYDFRQVINHLGACTYEEHYYETLEYLESMFEEYAIQVCEEEREEKENA